MVYKIFNQQAERYDLWYKRNPVLFECEAKVMRAFKLQGRGLSIGIGTGRLDAEVHPQIGVEPALNMLKIAESRGITPICAAGEYLPFKERSFNFALMTATICFLDDPEKAILEAKRILRSEGKLIICIVPRNSAWGKEYMQKAEDGHLFYRYAHFYSMFELEDMLKRSGFRMVTTKATLSYPPSAKPRIEEPSNNSEGKGFLCVEAAKIG